MRILVYGAGVIGSVNAARLEDAGLDATLLAPRIGRFPGTDLAVVGLGGRRDAATRETKAPADDFSATPRVAGLPTPVSDRLYAAAGVRATATDRAA